MVYEVDECTKVSELFRGWNETMITSCLQGVMGKIYVTDTLNPSSACAVIGCFAFFAGLPDKELVMQKPTDVSIMVPQNQPWAAMIRETCPFAKEATRYAIRKDTSFDIQMLRQIKEYIPAGYELREIDATLYDLCLQDPVTRDFVSAFKSKDQYLALGLGMVLVKDGKIVAGASSYTRYLEGIEIEVDTVPEERRSGLASIVCASLILKCLEKELYPSWDAQNLVSVRLAEKLGYEMSHSYLAYYTS